MNRFSTRLDREYGIVEAFRKQGVGAVVNCQTPGEVRRGKHKGKTRRGGK